MDLPYVPRVSICIPTYNPGRYLAPAIQSVLNQNLDDVEVIVVDDASTEPVSDTVAAFHDRRIRFYRNTRNLGLARNWNRCLEVATGKYVSIFHQDDVMKPGSIRRKVEILDAHETVGFVFSDIQRIDESGEGIGGHWAPQPPADCIMSGKDLYGMVAASGNLISCPSVMARSECYRRLGGFETRLAFALDLEMWLRIAAAYDVAYVCEPLVMQRVHSRQETARFAGTGRDYLDVLRAYKIRFGPNANPELLAWRARAYRVLASQALPMMRWKLRQGHFGAAFRYASVAFRAICHSL